MLYLVTSLRRMIEGGASVIKELFPQQRVGIGCEFFVLLRSETQRYFAAQRIIRFARQVLLPDEEMIAARLPMLQLDLTLLDQLDQTLRRGGFQGLL
mgnify:CR=1 FL=1